MIVALIFIVFGGISHASFGLGQKRFEPLSWEAFWLPFAFISMIIIPLVWAFTLGSDVWRILSAIPIKVFLYTIFFGACWGLAAIFWGKALVWIGMSLTYGIILSITMATGSLIPMLRIKGIAQSSALPFILLGTAVMFGGVALVTLAGIRRDRLQIEGGKKIKGVASGKLFKLGLLIALFFGIAWSSSEHWLLGSTANCTGNRCR